MSVIPSDLIVYGCANHQETDAGTQGGAISTSKKLVFNDITPTGNMQVVSSNAGDTTQTVTITGRNAGGTIISEVKTLTGVTVVPMTVQTSWERLLKAVKSATTAGDVAAEAVTATLSNTAQGGANSTASLMAYITLNAAASAADDFYNGQVIRTTGGTGPNQIRSIIDYDGTTKRAYVSRDWAVVPDATTTFKLSPGMVFDKAPVEILEIRRPFYAAAADVPGGSSRDYYEKVFLKNVHATLDFTVATIAELTDPTGKITFALGTALDDTGTSTDRRTVPASGVSAFDSVTKNVANSQNLTAGTAQSIWLKLTLAAGDAAQKSTYSVRASGAST